MAADSATLLMLIRLPDTSLEQATPTSFTMTKHFWDKPYFQKANAKDVLVSFLKQNVVHNFWHSLRQSCCYKTMKVELSLNVSSVVQNPVNISGKRLPLTVGIAFSWDQAFNCIFRAHLHHSADRNLMHIRVIMQLPNLTEKSFNSFLVNRLSWFERGREEEIAWRSITNGPS